MKNIKRCELCLWRRILQDLKDFVYCDWFGCKKPKDATCEMWERFE